MKFTELVDSGEDKNNALNINDLRLSSAGVLAPVGKTDPEGELV